MQLIDLFPFFIKDPVAPHDYLSDDETQTADEKIFEAQLSDGGTGTIYYSFALTDATSMARRFSARHQDLYTPQDNRSVATKPPADSAALTGNQLNDDDDLVSEKTAATIVESMIAQKSNSSKSSEKTYNNRTHDASADDREDNRKKK